jgi:hypothetical protein
MKRSQLEAIIREALSEVLNEQTPTTPQIQSLKNQQKKITLDIAKAEYDKAREEAGKMEEGDIDEMANVAIRYQLSPDANAADFTGKKNRILAAMQANGEPMSKIDVASELGYDKQNPINADFMALVASGVITPAGEQRAPRFSRPQPEPAAAPVGDDMEDGEDELPSGYEDPEGGVAGDMTDDEIDASFAKAISGDDEEDIEDIEVDTATPSAKSMSDDEFQAWMAYQELERRLANVKSNILKARKSRPTPGDIADRPSNEVENLRDLKKRLEDKMMAIVSQFPSVAKDYKAPEIEVPDEEPLDEWTINKMKFYAGIIK